MRRMLALLRGRHQRDAIRPEPAGIFKQKHFLHPVRDLHRGVPDGGVEVWGATKGGFKMKRLSALTSSAFWQNELIIANPAKRDEAKTLDNDCSARSDISSTLTSRSENILLNVEIRIGLDQLANGVIRAVENFEAVQLVAGKHQLAADVQKGFVPRDQRAGR